MSKICATCGYTNEDEATVCVSCQSSLSGSSGESRTTLGEIRHTSFLAGDLIADRYEVVSELGRGGMGIVYRVKDTKLRGRDTALKMIHPELVANPEARHRFEDEVATCLDLNHHSIIRVYNLESTGELHFFTMEYLQGRSLSELITSRKGKIPPFSLGELTSIMAPLLSGLHYAHQHTIHRDLKPDNVMVLGDFPEIEIKILDFGIARTMSPSRFTQTAQSMGTPYYMAPEQLQESKSVDHRADLYSVGMIIYEMLTGELAVGRFPLPSEVVPGLPPKVDEIIENTLTPFADRRYKSAAEVKDLLASAVTDFQAAEDKKKEQQLAKKRAVELRHKEEQARQAREKRKKEEVEKRKLEEEKHAEQERLKAQESKRQAERQARKEAELKLAEEERQRKVEDHQKAKAAEAARVEAEEQAINQAEAEKQREMAAQIARGKRLRKNLVLAGVVVTTLVSGGGYFYYQHEKEQTRIEMVRAEAEEERKIKLAAEKRRQAEEIKKKEEQAQIAADQQKQKVATASKKPPPVYTDGTTGMEFVYIPEGCFEMGSPSSEDERDKDEGPVHKVCIDAFYMGKYEVTQGEYHKLTGSNPSRFKNGSNYPVEEVSWNDSQSYISKLNSKSGKKYRLPTEAEWEYAARAGTTTPFYFGTTISTSQANYNGNYTYGSGRKGKYREKTTSVGSFPANSFGLYEMHGNVWEWCQDWHGKDYYKSSPRNNPQGPSSGSTRVFRGGSWNDFPWDLRSAYRNWRKPVIRSRYLGFRLVLPVQQAR